MCHAYIVTVSTLVSVYTMVDIVMAHVIMAYIVMAGLYSYGHGTRCPHTCFPFTPCVYGYYLPVPAISSCSRATMRDNRILVISDVLVIIVLSFVIIYN